MQISRVPSSIRGPKGVNGDLISLVKRNYRFLLQDENILI